MENKTKPRSPLWTFWFLSCTAAGRHRCPYVWAPVTRERAGSTSRPPAGPASFEQVHLPLPKCVLPQQPPPGSSPDGCLAKMRFQFRSFRPAARPFWTFSFWFYIPAHPHCSGKVKVDVLSPPCPPERGLRDQRPRHLTARKARPGEGQAPRRCHQLLSPWFPKDSPARAADAPSSCLRDASRRTTSRFPPAHVTLPFPHLPSFS